MKVIFIQEVSGVANRNSVHEVADGFALNYLLPRGLAVLATQEKIQALVRQQESLEKNRSQQQNRAQALAGELNGRTITIVRRASSTGTLYAAISPQMISDVAKEQLKVNLQTTQVIVPSHIKTTGQHKVRINLSDGINATLNLQINAA